ncbi:hypothetical protein [Candidatus Electronema sp. PJ]|uniref:hypothetical protein n=1 Tax=Candidatus Electronema sp. PJ TaxID=3401572 RepID=UPI003AA801C5
MLSQNLLLLVYNLLLPSQTPLPASTQGISGSSRERNPAAGCVAVGKNSYLARQIQPETTRSAIPAVLSRKKLFRKSALYVLFPGLCACAFSF